MWGGDDNKGYDDDETGHEQQQPRCAPAAAVRIYQPILYGRKPSPLLCRDREASFVGGRVVRSHRATGDSSDAAAPATACCSSCRDALFLLLQLFVPSSSSNGAGGAVDGGTAALGRTLRVYGCNRAACANRLFADGQPLSYGGGPGVVVCTSEAVTAARQQQSSSGGNGARDAGTSENSTGGRPPSAAAAAAAAWTADEDDNANDAQQGGVGGDDDWDVDATTADTDQMPGGDPAASSSMDDIEAKLAAIETGGGGWAGKPSSSKKEEQEEAELPARKKGAEKSASQDDGQCFSCYELHSIREPPAPARRRGGAGDDDDDDDDEDEVGIEGSDDKIQKMLARYMAEEEDEDILSALKQSGAGSGAGNNNRKGGERDERLSAEDRALLAYTNRLKRSPRQVVRHAPGGVPMWSIPTTTTATTTTASASATKGNQKKSRTPQKTVATEKPIPACGCGSRRRFEVQLLPSLLHVLDVDKHAKASVTEKKSTGSTIEDLFSGGGMNWGNISVYTCSNANCAANEAPRDEYVVVQASVEGQASPGSDLSAATRRQLHSYEPVVIAEGTDFVADGDDSHHVCGTEYDEEGCDDDESEEE